MREFAGYIELWLIFVAVETIIRRVLWYRTSTRLSSLHSFSPPSFQQAVSFHLLCEHLQLALIDVHIIVFAAIHVVVHRRYQ